MGRDRSCSSVLQQHTDVMIMNLWCDKMNRKEKMRERNEEEKERGNDNSHSIIYHMMWRMRGGYYNLEEARMSPHGDRLTTSPPIPNTAVVTNFNAVEEIFILIIWFGGEKFNLLLCSNLTGKFMSCFLPRRPTQREWWIADYRLCIHDPTIEMVNAMTFIDQATSAGL